MGAASLAASSSATRAPSSRALSSCFLPAARSSRDLSSRWSSLNVYDSTSARALATESLSFVVIGDGRAAAAAAAGGARGAGFAAAASTRGELLASVIVASGARDGGARALLAVTSAPFSPRSFLRACSSCSSRTAMSACASEMARAMNPSASDSMRAWTWPT